MTQQPFKRMPALIAFGVIVLVCLVRAFQFEFLERLERNTYDKRVREALRYSPSTTTNLGFVFIDEESLRQVRTGVVGLKFGLLWPRQVYGRLIAELREQGAESIGLDIVLGDLRTDHVDVLMENNQLVTSDQYFAINMKRAGNVVLAADEGVVPPPLFLTNAAALGDITADKDSDSILRRVQAFRTYRQWHPVFLQAEEEYGLHLDKAWTKTNTMIIPGVSGENFSVPLNQNGDFDMTDLAGEKLPAGTARYQKPYAETRVWDMGVVLAARRLGLNLDEAQVDLPHGRIALRGHGVERVLPVDQEGFFYVDWCLSPTSPRLTREAIHSLLGQYRDRLQGKTAGITNRWKGKIAVVGSSVAAGNNLTDLGATPLSKNTLLVSKHWNVANSIITGRFVRRSPLAIDLALITLLGIVAAAFTWEMRVPHATSLIILMGLVYIVVATWVYIRYRYWIPIIAPVGGAIFMTYVCTVAWKAIFEQAERRRVRSIFSTVVSPKIVNELLQFENLSLGGARREITVLFADVRGFTEFTDSSQEKVAEFVRKNNLSGAAAETCFDQQARETLGTVNLYLGLVADTIIKHDGTLDKFIGDCVMAFWGAPTPNPSHASTCVRAAMEAQRAVHALNLQRADENQRRERDNQTRAAAGLEPSPLLPLLLLGTGINTGMATVGMMGSEAKTRNYTVFGREVNLASRLEGLSGRGRIFISQATYERLLREDPALAATCLPQESQKVKGISSAVKIYEVPWQQSTTEPLELSAPAPDVKRSPAIVVQKGEV